MWTNFSKPLIKIQNLSFTEMHLKISSAKWHKFKCNTNIIWRGREYCFCGIKLAHVFNPYQVRNCTNVYWITGSVSSFRRLGLYNDFKITLFVDGILASTVLCKCTVKYVSTLIKSYECMFICIWNYNKNSYLLHWSATYIPQKEKISTLFHPVEYWENGFIAMLKALSIPHLQIVNHIQYTFHVSKYQKQYIC